MFLPITLNYLTIKRDLLLFEHILCFSKIEGSIIPEDCDINGDLFVCSSMKCHQIIRDWGWEYIMIMLEWSGDTPGKPMSAGRVMTEIA